MLRASFRAGMTTLTSGGFSGGAALSSSSDLEPSTLIAVTMGVTIHGSAASTATVVSVTHEYYALAGLPDRSATSFTRTFQPSRRLGTVGTQFAA